MKLGAIHRLVKERALSMEIIINRKVVFLPLKTFYFLNILRYNDMEHLVLFRPVIVMEFGL